MVENLKDKINYDVENIEETITELNKALSRPILGNIELTAISEQDKKTYFPLQKILNLSGITLSKPLLTMKICPRKIEGKTTKMKKLLMLVFLGLCFTTNIYAVGTLTAKQKEAEEWIKKAESVDTPELKIEYCTKAIEIDSEDADAYRNRGIAYVQQAL